MLNITPADQTMILILVLLSFSMAVTLRLGLFSIAPAGFTGIGAYVAGVLMVHYGWHFAAASVVAIAACGVIGALLSLPLARISGIYTSIATLAFVVVATGVENTLGITGGTIGLIGIPHYDARLALVLTILGCLVAGFLYERSNFGRKRDVIGSDPALASVLGMRVGLNRSGAIVLSAMLAGWVGALYSTSFYVVAPDAFSFFFAIKIAAYTVIGGVIFWAGPLVGGVVMGVLSAELRNYPHWGDIVIGTVMVGMLVLYPEGLAGPLHKLFRRRFRPLSVLDSLLRSRERPLAAIPDADNESGV